MLVARAGGSTAFAFSQNLRVTTLADDFTLFDADFILHIICVYDMTLPTPWNALVLAIPSRRMRSRTLPASQHYDL